MHARARANVNDIVGFVHGLLVVLDHDDRVAKVAQRFERGDQLGVVTRVQTDAGLVQNIQHACQGRADLRGKSDALRLAARKRASLAPQRQISKPYADKKTESRADLLENFPRNDRVTARKLQRIDKFQCVFYRHGAKIVDIEPAHRDAQHHGRKTLAAAHGAIRLLHELRIILLTEHAAVLHAALDHFQDSVEGGGLLVRLSAEMARDAVNAITRAVQQRIQRVLAVFTDGHVQIKARNLAYLGKQGAVPAVLLQCLEAVDRDRAPAQRKTLIGNHLGGGYGLHLAKTRAYGTCARGIVEGKHTGLQLPDRNAVLLAGIALRERKLDRLALTARHGHDQQVPLRQIQRSFHRVAKAGAYALLERKSVHHDLDIVLFVLVQRDVLAKVVKAAVDAHAGVSASFGIGQHLFMHTLLRAHNGCQHQKALALGQLADLIYDGVGALPSDLLAADRAMRHAHACVQQTQIVVDLCHGTHGGTRVFGGSLLVDRNGGAQAVDGVHVGLVHLPQKHTRIRGQRLDKTAVSLGIHGIKGQGGFSRARKARQYDKLIARNLHVNIFEIIDACPANHDFLKLHWFYSLFIP